MLFQANELSLSSPVCRLGLDASNSNVWLQMLAVAFSCYHALKLSHRAEILDALACGHHCQVHGRLMEHAKVFSSEIVRET